MSKLFEPITIREVKIRNRIAVSPMCQYSAGNGIANDWHFAHLSRFALGGFGVVMVEATSVTPEGRISHGDLGLWNDEQMVPLAHISAFLSAHGSTPAIQLGHAGRKASSKRLWDGGSPLTNEDSLTKAESPWPVFAPSSIPFTNNAQTPLELDPINMNRILESFVSATKRANMAGFKIVEVHCAHGYLLHEFLSPITNNRVDEYGGNLENRMRFPINVISAVRSVWPLEKPLFVRISAVDAAQGGWNINDSIIFAKKLKSIGVDLIDCSSGGIVAKYDGEQKSGYQVQYAAQILNEAKISTMAVGLITNPQQAEEIIKNNYADFIALGREALNNPNWPIHAKSVLSDTISGYELCTIQSRGALLAREKALKHH